MIATFLYFLAVVVFRKAVVDKDGNRIPPGPLLRYPCLPDYPERILDTWAKKHGPLCSFYLGRELFVLVSDANMARDLFVNNGAIFSSRANYYIKNQINLKGRGITASPYGDTW